MSHIVVGLFPSQENAKAVSESIEKVGFNNSDYIVYINETKKEQKPSFWKKLLGIQEIEVPEVDSLIVSIEADTQEELKKAKEAYNANNAVKVYEFNDMTIEEAKSLDYIKKIVEIRAKSHIYAMPEIVTSSSEISTGMNAEVNIGK